MVFWCMFLRALDGLAESIRGNMVWVETTWMVDRSFAGLLMVWAYRLELAGPYDREFWQFLVQVGDPAASNPRPSRSKPGSRGEAPLRRSVRRRHSPR